MEEKFRFEGREAECTGMIPLSSSLVVAKSYGARCKPCHSTARCTDDGMSSLLCSQGSAIGPLLFSVFINVFCDAVRQSKTLQHADDIKIYRTMISPEDSNPLQSNINIVHSGVVLSVRISSSLKLKFSPSPRSPTYLSKIRILPILHNLEESIKLWKYLLIINFVLLPRQA
jgi:hypothetical protein